MTTVKITDNCIAKDDQLQGVKSIVTRIVNAKMSQLSREGLLLFPREIAESEDLEADPMILQKIGDTYKVGNIMGYLGYKDERLIIKSRFSQGSDDYFLQYLMQKVLGMPNLLDFGIHCDESERLFMYQIFLFPFYLRIAMRKGIFRTYVHHECNDTNVHGRINIVRHLRENIPFTGRIAYDVRDFSGDNPVMELIRHTLEYIAVQPYGSAVLHDVQNEAHMVIEATGSYRRGERRTIIDKNIQIPVRHAFYSEYRRLQQLCIMILDHNRHGLNGTSSRVQGIIFDGAWLWEEYVNSLISTKFHHPRNKIKSGTQQLFNGHNGTIYPDFISKAYPARVIADAKYKPVANIHQEDYLQILAYMFRFDAHQGFFLYPESHGGEGNTLHMLKGTTFDNDISKRLDITVAKYGFQIPGPAVSYMKYVEKMRQSERTFRESLFKKMVDV